MSAPDGAAFPGRVLLATDGSEDASVAARAAVDLAVGGGAELHVVHVFHPAAPAEFAGVALGPRSPAVSEGDGRRLLEEQAALIEGNGGRVAGTHLRLGSPVDGILRTAEEVGAGLVVIGGRGLGGVGRLLLGSVSEGVVYHARCPVLVVREETWPPARVLLADDASEGAGEAARLAASIAGLVGADAVLVQVYPRVLHDRLQDEGAPEVREALARAEDRLRERASGLAGLAHGPVRAALVVDEGTAGIDGVAVTLLDLAWEGGFPTLVAVGRRGGVAEGRRRMGSVSTKVIRAHAGPILVHPGGSKARARRVLEAAERAGVGGPM